MYCLWNRCNCVCKASCRRRALSCSCHLRRQQGRKGVFGDTPIGADFSRGLPSAPLFLAASGGRREEKGYLGIPQAPPGELPPPGPPLKSAPMGDTPNPAMAASPPGPPKPYYLSCRDKGLAWFISPKCSSYCARHRRSAECAYPRRQSPDEWGGPTSYRRVAASSQRNSGQAPDLRRDA